MVLSLGLRYIAVRILITQLWVLWTLKPQKGFLNLSSISNQRTTKPVLRVQDSWLHWHVNWNDRLFVLCTLLLFQRVHMLCVQTLTFFRCQTNVVKRVVICHQSFLIHLFPHLVHTLHDTLTVGWLVSGSPQFLPGNPGQGDIVAPSLFFILRHSAFALRCNAIFLQSFILAQIPFIASKYRTSRTCLFG